MVVNAQPTSSTDNIPLSSAVVPGDQTPRIVQGSLLKLTDSNNNVLTGVTISDARIEAVLNGQMYSALYTTTIGVAAQGQYALSVFNPSSSGKNVLVTSIKTMVNYSLTTTWTYLNTSNPAYSDNVPVINLKGSGPVSVLTAGNVTRNAASVAFPGSGHVDMALSNPEVIFNGCVYLLPPGNGINVIVFVGNSQEYAIATKWIEY